MFVSYETAEKFNVEMNDPPQCQGRSNAKNWFSPMLVSVWTVMPNTISTTLNTICACIGRNMFKLFSATISYYFNLLKISERISKAPPISQIKL